MMNFLNSIKSYFVTAYAEMKKVVWPTRAQAINHTIIVIVSVVIVVAIFGLLDLGLSKIVSYFIQYFAGR